MIVNSDGNHHDELIQSPIELSPPETQISTSSLMTTGTLTSSSDKLLNMISPEECSGVSNLSPSPSPPQSPSVHNNTSQSSSSLGSNKRLATHSHQKYHPHHYNHNNINNNTLNFNGSNKDMQSSISSIGTSTASNNLNNYNNNNDFDMMTSTSTDMASCESDGMSKSKSNESQLSMNGGSTNKQWHQNGSAMMSNSEISNDTPPIPAPRTKYPIGTSTTINNHHFDYNHENNSTVDSIGSHSIVTPIIVSDTSAPPRSPCTPVRGMGHMIQHRFSKKFKWTSSTCDLCNKQMFFGFKCTECKYRCHKDCKSNVPPSCGLPKEFVDEFKKTLYSDGLNASPNLPRAGLMPVKRNNEARHRPQIMHTIPFHHGADSSSAGSSCNSSSPSSPALLTIPPQTPANKSQFNFPEISSSSTSGQSHQISHHVNNFSSYPNTIIEDAEHEHTGHSKHCENHMHSTTAMYLRSNYQHSSLMSPNNIDNHIKLNGSIIDSNGKFKVAFETFTCY